MEGKQPVRIAVIGTGIMGSSHVKEISAMSSAHLAAVCDIRKDVADQIGGLYSVPAYSDSQELLEAEKPDGVVIATPHYAHTPISIDCLGRGIHVLVEKPLAVHVNDGRKMIAAYEEAKARFPGLVFAIMFQQRTHTFWRKIKSMIDQGELGKLVRATWLITDWYRTQAYYDNGGWRATYQGEGGGVLLNQCPHNLDLYQWFFGMPRRISGLAAFGKYHHIEVEDEVTGIFEHENGMVGHFITTTAESPGTNRLEIAGEKGRIIFEDGKLTFFRNQASMLEFIRTSPAPFDKVPGQPEVIPNEYHSEPGHTLVLEAFSSAIQNGTPPVAQAPEGLNSLTLGNGIMLSHFLKHPVELPLDGDAYAAILQEKIRTSTFVKAAEGGPVGDISKSFGYY